MDRRTLAAIARRRRGNNAPVFGVLPPNDQSHLVWQVDPDVSGSGAFIVGPAGTLTTPVQTSGAKGHYTYAAADIIDYGDALDSTWTGGAFTVYLALNFRANDPSGFVLVPLSKYTDATHAQFGIATVEIPALPLGAITATVYYAGSNVRYDQVQLTPTLNKLGRYVLVLTFDPALARGSRLKIGVNGAPPSAAGFAQLGADGTMSDTTAHLTQGANGPFTSGSEAPKETSYVFAYSTAHTNEQIAENVEWFQQYKGWQ